MSVSSPIVTPASQGRLVIQHGTVVLPDRVVEDGQVVIHAGRIETVGKRKAKSIPTDEAIDAQGGYIAPGFVDIHVHGGDGADFMDGNAEAVRTACRCHLRHGTTTIFPTTTTGSPAQLTAMLLSCSKVQADWSGADGARLAGVHFYGPYFARDMVGCHNPLGQRAPDVKEYLDHFAIPNADLLGASGKRKRNASLIRIATCAAELPGAAKFYEFASRQKCLVTCGHSNASWTEMAQGYRVGLRHVDHFWCAMSSVPSLRQRFGTPMQASMAEFVLAHPEMSTEVIADGCHLAPELINFAYRMIGPKRLCLVTDASRAVDMPPGRYRFGPATNGEWFVSDGEVGRMPDGSALASSVAGMDRMVRTAWKATHAPIFDVIRMASLTPAERAGVDDDVGSLEPGKLGDVLILTKQLRLKRVIIAGS
jgi:N-acetylglucosamine-6-phosphate deacetylase